MVLAPVILWAISLFVAVFAITGYDIVIKQVADRFDAFLFTAILSIAACAGHILAFIVYREFNQAISFSLKPEMVMYAVFAGLCIVVVDLGFFYAMKYGTFFQTNAIWLIGGLLLTLLVSLFLFQEEASMVRIIGLILGIVSIVLMVK